VRCDTSSLGFTLDSAAIDAFWARVLIPADREDPELCWLYRDDAPGDRGKYGHTRIWVTREHRVLVHRLAYVLCGGVLTHDCVIHSCDHPACCAGLSHLRSADRLANARDRDARGRRRPARGQNSPAAKLTDREVQAIARARALGVPVKTLAVAFGVSVATVYARTDKGERDLAAQVRDDQAVMPDTHQLPAAGPA
jgi:hypothetical protein